MGEEVPRLPDASHAIDIDHAQLMAAAYASVDPSTPLPPQEQYAPIDRKLGHEAQDTIRTAITIFRNELMPALPIGAKTRAELERKIDTELSHPDAIIITQEHEVQYGWEGFDSPGEEANIAAGMPMIERCLEWTEEAALLAGLSLNQEEIRQIAYYWVVWHELGHTLQHSYQDSVSQPGRPGALTHDVLRAGVAPVVFPGKINTLQKFANHRAVAEGFPEGLAQTLVEKYLTSHYGVAAEDAAKFRRAMTPPVSREGYKEAYRVLSGPAVADVTAPVRKQFEIVHSIGSDLGYGRPCTPEETMRILEQTQ